jgi:hypothetical protein
MAQMDIAQIRISDGSFVTVDAEDFERLSKYRWSAHGKGYAVRGVHIGNRKYRHIAMHREIVGAEPGEYVDHINGDKSDNRKANLRIATNSQNLMNRGRNRNNTSGYKGVRYEKRRDKWAAEIKKDYKSKFLGYFDCKHEAARAYNRAALELHGEFAKLNEIKGDR